ncbi:MAG: hypothetical protein ACI8WA_000969, partial [Polaribacter sp.]
SNGLCINSGDTVIISIRIWQMYEFLVFYGKKMLGKNF